MKRQWFNRGPLGAGNWITDAEGTQIAVTYGARINPTAAADTLLITRAPDLLEAMKQINDLLRHNPDAAEPLRYRASRAAALAKNAISLAERATPDQGANPDDNEI